MSCSEKRGTDDLSGLSKEPAKKKVLVAISGGVDSSVAAFLLKKKGFQVHTTTFWLWDYPGSPGYQGKENSCCSIGTAEMVADQLDLPHYMFDLSDKFRNQVVEPTIEAYLNGITPNPCARCNHLVRFELLRQKAKELGFPYIATGHHVRTVRRDGTNYLLKGVDGQKDQSYFLYGLGQPELEKAKFPVGDYHKDEIYDIAGEEGLISAELEESQDLCFVPGEDYRNFLLREVPDRIEQGDIVDMNGNKLGTHEGLPFYTVGQRRGLGLESNQARYVVELDYENNRLVVGPQTELYSSGLVASDCSWISGFPPARSNLEVKIRYRADPVASEIEVTDGRMDIQFENPQKSVTPGQIAAVYRGEKLLGGGIITKGKPVQDD